MMKMNEQIIVAREFSINNDKEELLKNSSFSICKGNLITFSYSSQYASDLPQIFLNSFLEYKGIFLYHNQRVSKKNKISSFYVSNDIKLIESMSISENIMSLQPKKMMFSYYNPRKALKIMRLYEQRHPLPFDLLSSVKNIKSSYKYMILLLKAIVMDCEIILLDELPEECDENDFKWILNVIEYYKKKGKTFLYFTRRTGRLVPKSDYIYFIHFHSIVNMMFSDEYNEEKYRKALFGEQLKIVEHRVRYANYDKKISSVNFKKVFTDSFRLDVFQGEVVGILDMDGNFNNPLYHYFESEYDYSICGKVFRSYEEAVEQGLAMVSLHENNQIFESLSLKENLSFQILRQISKGFTINKKIEKYLTGNYLNKFHLSSHMDRENEFSKNMQLIIYRWLMSNPKLMIIDNPLYIDLNSNFYKDFQMTIDDVVEKGVSVIMISTLPNLCLKICDRLLVVKKQDEYKMFDLRKVKSELVNAYIKE